MHILIPNLHENRPTIRQEIPRYRQPIPQIRQIGMNPIPPGISERLYLLRLTGDVARQLPSLTSRLVVDHWKLELKLMP